MTAGALLTSSFLCCPHLEWALTQQLMQSRMSWFCPEINLLGDSSLYHTGSINTVTLINILCIFLSITLKFYVLDLFLNNLLWF